MQETPPIAGVSIRRRLAVGGMGELFVADETLPDGSTRACVVKRLLPGAGPEEQRLFEREALALAALTRLATPHIVKLYRAGPGWLLLEWIDGVDLGALLEHRRRRGRPLPVGAALAIVLGIARALEALGRAVDDDGQALALVHRDVHPGNVLLGVDGAVKLADLGVVALGSAPTMAGLKGTLVWMAPEQLTSGRTSPASDLYAAGLIAYEAFTGQPARPIGNLGMAELLAARSALPVAPVSLRAELGPALSEALLTALAVEPAARPAVGQWLESVLAAARPIVPDTAALAALVNEVDARAVVAPPQRTYVARNDPAQTGAAATGEPSAPARGAWGKLALVAVLSAGAVGASLWASGSAGEGERKPPDATVAAAAPDVRAQLPVADDARATGEAPPTTPEVAPIDASIEVAPIDASIERTAEHGPFADATPADGSAPREVERLLDTFVGDAPARSVREVGAATAETVALSRRLRVLAPDGPVHVRGGAQRGLAPWVSEPLREGEALALHLTGGVSPMVAVVRIRARGAGLVASIGAPQGELHKVTCAGRATLETPVFGIAVGAGGVACRLEANDGRTMSFVLLDVAE